MADADLGSPKGQQLVSTAGPLGCVGIVQKMLFVDGDFEMAEVVIREVEELTARASRCGEAILSEMRGYLANHEMPIEARLHCAYSAVKRAEQE